MNMAPGNNESMLKQMANAQPSWGAGNAGQGSNMSGVSGYTPPGMGAPPIMGGERPGMGQGFSPLGVSSSGGFNPGGGGGGGGAMYNTNNANQNLMGQKRNRFTVGQQAPQGTQQMGQAQGPLGQMRQGMPEGGSQNLIGQKQGQLDQMRKGL
jgi:hypothetical protein